MKIKNPLPRPINQITSMISYLESQRNEFMSNGCISCALAVGSQLEMLKWAYNMQEDRE